MKAGRTAEERSNSLNEWGILRKTKDQMRRQRMCRRVPAFGTTHSWCLIGLALVVQHPETFRESRYLQSRFGLCWIRMCLQWNLLFGYASQCNQARFFSRMRNQMPHFMVACMWCLTITTISVFKAGTAIVPPTI